MIVKALFSIKWFSKENRKISAVTEKAQEEFYNMNLRFPKKSFIYLRGIGKMVNTKNDYKRTYPILIGCGDHDVDEEKEALREWKESDNEIKTAIISGAGHLVNMDNPLLFNKTLEKFWLQAERKNP